MSALASKADPFRLDKRNPALGGASHYCDRMGAAEVLPGLWFLRVRAEEIGATRMCVSLLTHTIDYLLGRRRTPKPYRATAIISPSFALISESISTTVRSRALL